MKLIAREIIAKLDLQPLPGEGGWFRRTWQSDYQLEIAGETRLAATCIYFLITPDNPSRWHRVPGPELFHFYAGSPVILMQLSKTGDLKEIILGSDVLADQQPQCLVPAGSWQTLRVSSGGDGYALLAASMTPGYDDRDFELAKLDELQQQFPQHRVLIERYA